MVGYLGIGHILWCIGPIHTIPKGSNVLHHRLIGSLSVSVHFLNKALPLPRRRTTIAQVAQPALHQARQDMHAGPGTVSLSIPWQTTLGLCLNSEGGNDLNSLQPVPQSTLIGPISNGHPSQERVKVTFPKPLFLNHRCPFTEQSHSH